MRERVECFGPSPDVKIDSAAIYAKANGPIGSLSRKFAAKKFRKRLLKRNPFVPQTKNGILPPRVNTFPGKTKTMISRRNFRNGVTATLAAAGTLHPLLTWAAQGDNPPVPGKEGMILRSFRFLDIEMPMEFMNPWITPVPHFFVRNHMHMPSTLLDTSDWRLNIGGAVDKPVRLTTADLRKLPPPLINSAIEYAGNGRAF